MTEVNAYVAGRVYILDQELVDITSAKKNKHNDWYNEKYE